MPSFADITQRLGDMATGLTVGTLEREQADRTEVRDLIERSVSHGRQGVDYAPYFQPDNVRPANVDTLQDLTQRSGAGTSPGMLQYPWMRDQTILQEREDARIAAAETGREASIISSEERQQRTIDAQERRAEERARRPSRLDSLQPQQWSRIREIQNTVIDDALSPQLPNYFVTAPNGSVSVNPIYAAARRRIAQDMETRLPFQIPNNIAGIHQIVSRIYNDLTPGITVTRPESGWFSSTPGAITFDPSRAPARRPDVAPGTPGSEIPSDGTTLSPTGVPGQVGQGGGQVGRSSAPQEAFAQRIQDTYAAPITRAAAEYSLSPRLIAALSAAEGGQMVQGPVIPGRTERAFGLMQILPSTYAQIAREIGEGRRITDPEANIRVGTAYLGRLMRQFNGDTAMALAAYNWGPERVEGLLRRFSTRAEVFMHMPETVRTYIERVGAGAGGWDSTERNTLPRLSGQGGTAQAPAGTPTGNVPQTAPTAQHIEQVNQFIDLTVRSAAMIITSTTSVADRRTMKDRLLAGYPAAIQRQYPQYVDHIMLELRRQLARIS